MLTNILLLYMTQEAIAKARARLSGRKPAATDGGEVPPQWMRRKMRDAVSRTLRQTPTRH